MTTTAQAEQKDTLAEYLKRHILETSATHEEWARRIEVLGGNNAEK